MMTNFKRTIIVLAILTAFYGESAAARILTTNDVDVLFTRSTNEYISTIQRRCWDSGIRDLDVSQTGIRNYAFEKLLAIPVNTNMLGFTYLLGEKSSWIEMAEESFRVNITDVELRKILEGAVATQLIPTNTIMGLRAEAVQRDKEKWGRAVNYVGFPYENFRRWRNSYNVVKMWNKAVVKYRHQLVAFVCKKYEEIHADVPEKERREALKALLQEYGLLSSDQVGK